MNKVEQPFPNNFFEQIPTTLGDDFSLEPIFQEFNQEFNLFSLLIFGAAQGREGKYVF